MKENLRDRWERLFEKGRYLELKDEFQRKWTVEGPGAEKDGLIDPYALYFAIQALKRLGYFRLAYEAVSFLIKREKNNDIHLEYIRLNLHFQRIVKAIHLLDELRKMDKKLPEKTLGEIMGLYSRAYALAGSSKTSAAFLARAAEYRTDQNEISLILDQIFVLERLGEEEKIESVLEEATASHPDSFRLFLAQGALLSRRQRWKEAVLSFHDAARMRPEDFFPPYNLASVFIATGASDVAYDAFKDARNLAPDNDYSEKTAWGMAFSLFLEQKFEEAAAWFRKTRNEEMVRFCLEAQMERSKTAPVFLDMNLEAADNNLSAVDAAGALLDFFNEKSDDHFIQTRIVHTLPLAARESLEKSGLRTAAFQFSPQRLYSILKSGLPVIIELNDFSGRYFGVITGIDPKRGMVFIYGTPKKGYYYHDLKILTEFSEGWSLVSGPAEKMDHISELISSETDSLFRLLEEAEHAVAKGYPLLCGKKLQMVGKTKFLTIRRKLGHLLQMERSPYSNPAPTLQHLLKKTGKTPAALGFSVSEYLGAEDYYQASETAGRALSLGIKEAAFFKALSELKMGKIERALRFNSIALSRDPGNPDYLIQRASCLAREGDYEDSFRWFRLVEDSHPDYPPFLEALGEVCRLMGEYEKAESYLMQSLSVRPDSPVVWENLIALYEEQQKFHSADSVTRDMISRFRNQTWAVEMRTEYLLRRGEPEEALEFCNEILLDQPYSIQIRLAKIHCLQSLEEFDEIEKQFTTLLNGVQPGGENRRVFTEMAFFLTGSGRLEEAEEYLDLALAEGDYVPALIARSHWHAVCAEYGSAWHDLQNVMSRMSLTPDLLDFFYQLSAIMNIADKASTFILSLSRNASSLTHAGFLYEIMDSFEEAMIYYRKALKTRGDKSFPHYRLGRIFHKTADFDRACRHYRKALEHDRRHYGALEQLTLLEYALDNKSRAFNIVEQMISLYPEDDVAIDIYLNMSLAENRLERAYEYLFSIRTATEFPERNNVILGEIEEALHRLDIAAQFYEQALEIDDYYPLSYSHLAELEMKRGDYLKAMQWVDRLLENSPDHSEGYLFRAQIHEKRGMYNEARRDVISSIEYSLSDESETGAYDLLASVLENTEVEDYILDEEDLFNKPDDFLVRLGEAYERKGDLNSAKKLYLAHKPFRTQRRSYSALIGLIFVSRQENDGKMLKRINSCLHRDLIKAANLPNVFDPVKKASLFEAMAFFLETGDHNENNLTSSLTYWEKSIKLTRSPWAMEHSASICLELGEITGNEYYFRKSLRYLMEIYDPLDQRLDLAPMLGDVFYRLGRYEDAVREYSTCFIPGDIDPEMQPVFLRYLDALEKINSPVTDITDIAEQTLRDLGPDHAFDSYRGAIEDRIFHSYFRARKHRAALRSAISSRGFMKGLFRYVKRMFHPDI